MTGKTLLRRPWRGLGRHLSVVPLVLLAAFSVPVYCHYDVASTWQASPYHLGVQRQAQDHLVHDQESRLALVRGAPPLRTLRAQSNPTGYLLSGLCGLCGKTSGSLDSARGHWDPLGANRDGRAHSGECQMEGPSGSGQTPTSQFAGVPIDLLSGPVLLVQYTGQHAEPSCPVLQAVTSPLEPPPRIDTWSA